MMQAALLGSSLQGHLPIVGQSYGDFCTVNSGGSIPTQNVEMASRFDLGRATTFDLVSLYIVTGVAANVVRIGIRRDNGSCYPSESVLLDAGTIDASVAGLKTLAISQRLAAGRYWITATLQGGAGASLWSRSVDPYVASDSASGFGGYYAVAVVPGALPNVFGGPLTPTVNGVVFVPYTILRAA